MTDLTPKAEALREKLADEAGEHDKGMRALAARSIARTIIEELGITEELIEFLRFNKEASWMWPDKVESFGRSATALSTLLELAGEE